MVDQSTQPAPPVAVPVALALIAGILGGSWWGAVWPWVVVAAFGVVLTVWFGSRRRGSQGDDEEVLIQRWRQWRVALLVTVVGLGGAWYVVRAERVPADDVSRWVTADGQLTAVRGVVVTRPVERGFARGPLGSFGYVSGSASAQVRVEEVLTGDGWVPASGRVLLTVGEPEHRLARMQRIEAWGWLRRIEPPLNPGEFDYARYMVSEGVVGRLACPDREHWHLADDQPAGPLPWLQRRRDAIGDAAAASLRIGLDRLDPRVGLMEALLLGRRDGLDRETTDNFRAVGLAHVLSISGAHLGILLGIVWLLARLVTGRPRRAALLVMAVLLLFVLAVPMRTPIVRAAVMAGLFCWGAWSGRRVSAVSLLAVAAILLLAWKPADLFNPGFQLSFAAVLGILLFAEWVTTWVWPRDPLRPYAGSFGWVAARWLVQAFVVSAVAFASVAPLVMFHFGLVSAWGILLSVLAFFPLGALLAVGYVKILAGLIVPSVSLVLAGPLRWMMDTLVGLVNEATRWPGAGLEVTPPGVWWVVGCSAALAALMAGWFSRRWVALSLTAALLVGWGWADMQTSEASNWLAAAEKAEAERGERVAGEVFMIAVGDGSCFVIRSDQQTLMFDCGSAQIVGVGRRVVVPTIHDLGIERLDLLVLSHADLDHFVGVLDLVDEVDVGRIVASRDLIEDATANPTGATAVLLGELSDRELEIEVLHPGWTLGFGHGELVVRWPPVDFEPTRFANNEKSLVMDFEVAGRRVRMHGDVQALGMKGLLETAPPEVDVTDLPHHGAWVPRVSGGYIEALGPELVLQSSSRAKLERDPYAWGPVLERLRLERRVSGRDGLVRVRIDEAGNIEHRAFGDR